MKKVRLQQLKGLFEELPDDCICEILSFVSNREKIYLTRLNKRFNWIINNLFITDEIKDFGGLFRWNDLGKIKNFNFKSIKKITFRKIKYYNCFELDLNELFRILDKFENLEELVLHHDNINVKLKTYEIISQLNLFEYFSSKKIRTIKYMPTSDKKNMGDDLAIIEVYECSEYSCCGDHDDDVNIFYYLKEMMKDKIKFIELESRIRYYYCHYCRKGIPNTDKPYFCYHCEIEFCKECSETTLKYKSCDNPFQMTCYTCYTDYIKKCEVCDGVRDYRASICSTCNKKFGHGHCGGLCDRCRKPFCRECSSIIEKQEHPFVICLKDCYNKISK